MPTATSPEPERNPTPLDCAPTAAEYIHVAKLTGLVSGIVLAIFLAYRTVSFAPDVFMIGFLGIIFAVFLASLSRLLGRFTGFGYRWNLAIVTVLLFASLVAFAVFFGTVMYEQVQQGARQFEAGGAHLVAIADQYPPLRVVVDSVPFLDAFRDDQTGPHDPSDPQATAPERQRDQQQSEEEDEEDEASDGMTEMAMSVTREVGSLAARFFVTTFGLVTNFVLIVIVGLYLSASPHAYQRAPSYVFPPRLRPEVYRILTVTGQTLWLWLLGRLFSMSISGGGTALFLYFLDVPSAILIGMITFLLGFIPNLGPLLAMGIAIFFVLPQGLTAVAIVIAVLGFFEMLESYLVAPLVTQHQVRLPPALVIFVQALMGITLGFIGLTVAAPLLVFALVLFNEVYRKKLLHEDYVATAGESAA